MRCGADLLNRSCAGYFTKKNVYVFKGEPRGFKYSACLNYLHLNVIVGITMTPEDQKMVNLSDIYHANQVPDVHG